MSKLCDDTRRVSVRGTRAVEEKGEDSVTLSGDTTTQLVDSQSKKKFVRYQTKIRVTQGIPGASWEFYYCKL